MSELRYDAGTKSWVLRAEPHIMMKARRHFPQIKTGAFGAIVLKSTDEVCRDLDWFLSRYRVEMAEQDRFLLRARADAHKQRETQVRLLLSGKVAPTDYALAVPLRDYQRVAADMAYALKGLLLGDVVGVGKTAAYIALSSRKETRPVVWVTMTHLQIQAQREIQRFCPGLTSVILKRGQPYDLGTVPDVVILNYAKVAGWAETLGEWARTLICDEAQELRHDDTARYRAVQHLRERVTWALLGTGTPIYNYGGEIYNVVEVARPGALGTWDEFVTAWAQERDQKGRAIVDDPRALGTHLRAEGLMLRRTRRDVGRELPALSRSVFTIDTDPKALAAIKGSAAELARIILSETGDGFFKMKAAGEMDRLLRQATGVAKAPYVAEFVKLLLESGEARVVVFAWHLAVYDLLAEELSAYGVARYTGEESPVQKDASLRRFRDGARVLLLSLRSGAGIDGLQHLCRVGVFAELDWSPKVHEQCEGRICRDGQEEGTTFYYPVSATGSDPVVLDVLGLKTSQADGIVDPDVDVVDVQVDPQRVRRLAEAVLGRAS